MIFTKLKTLILKEIKDNDFKVFVSYPSYYT